jgi:antirestriction protein ArdC
MPKTHGRLSEQEREQRRVQDRERLKQAAEQLLESTGWQRWVRARARNGLARYSVSNLCLILLAEPEASFVAGFKAWLELGYCVRKGERAIRIYAPMPVKPKQPAHAETDDHARLLFRVVPVFDRSQVDALDGRDQAPLEPPSQPLAGDTHAYLLTPAAELARQLGFSVTFRVMPSGVGGWCDYQAKAIVIDADAAANAQLRTLIHEITHALGVDYQTYSRE